MSQLPSLSQLHDPNPFLHRHLGPDAAEQQALQSAAEVEVIWVLRGQVDLLDTVRTLTLPSGALYTFVAMETKLSRQVRRVLLDTHKVDEAFLKAVGYWRAEGSEEE